MTTQIVTYNSGVKLIINMEVYERNARFNGMPVSFLRFVEFMGDWKSIEKVDL